METYELLVDVKHFILSFLRPTSRARLLDSASRLITLGIAQCMPTPSAARWIAPRLVLLAPLRRPSPYAVRRPTASNAIRHVVVVPPTKDEETSSTADHVKPAEDVDARAYRIEKHYACLLYTSPSPRDGLLSRMPSSA